MDVCTTSQISMSRAVTLILWLLLTAAQCSVCQLTQQQTPTDQTAQHNSLPSSQPPPPPPSSFEHADTTSSSRGASSSSSSTAPRSAATHTRAPVTNSHSRSLLAAADYGTLFSAGLPDLGSLPDLESLMKQSADAPGGSSGAAVGTTTALADPAATVAAQATGGGGGGSSSSYGGLELNCLYLPIELCVAIRRANLGSIR